MKGPLEFLPNNCNAKPFSNVWGISAHQGIVGGDELQHGATFFSIAFPSMWGRVC